MGIESTRYITRELAIDRITEITDLAKKGDFYIILNIFINSPLYFLYFLCLYLLYLYPKLYLIIP